MNNLSPIKFLKKTLVIEMRFALGASALLGSAATVGAGTTAAAFAGGAAATSIAAGTAAATTGLFGVGGALTAGSLLSGLSTGFSIFSKIAGGKAESQNLKSQAKAEQFNARNREIDRKRNLVRTLALQNVRQGASGVTSGIGSSAQAVQLEDISRAELDQSTDTYSTGQRVNQLKQNASNASTFSLLSAAGEAVRYGKRVAKRGSL